MFGRFMTYLFRNKLVPTRLSYSIKGSYLSGCLHYLAIFGTDARVIGNTELGGLYEDDARLIQVWKNINTVPMVRIIFLPPTYFHDW